MNELYEAAKSEHIYALYMDFKYVFEKVAHEKLFEKLQDFSIGGKLLNVLSSYLRERKQYVKVNNARSSFRIVTSGVPLFVLAYVNDHPRAVDKYSSYSYAGDFKVINESKTWLVEKTQTLSKDNHMSHNVEKSRILGLKGNASCECGDSLEVVSQQKGPWGNHIKKSLLE